MPINVQYGPDFRDYGLALAHAAKSVETNRRNMALGELLLRLRSQNIDMMNVSRRGGGGGGGGRVGYSGIAGGPDKPFDPSWSMGTFSRAQAGIDRQDARDSARSGRGSGTTGFAPPQQAMSNPYAGGGGSGFYGTMMQQPLVGFGNAMAGLASSVGSLFGG